MERILESALKGGVDMVQYRDKVSASKIMTRNALAFLRRTRKYKVPFLINDRVDVFLGSDADGIHLGQDDVPVSFLRRVIGEGKIIGLSCHSLKDVMAAQRQEVDYLGFGPVFRTKTKPHAGPRGLKILRRALGKTTLPVFPIGGITKHTIGFLPFSRQRRAAVCRTLCRASCVRQEAEILKKSLKNV